MKEELIRVLNNKLDDINKDIDSLVELNNKIANEEENLSFIKRILDLFEEDSEKSVNNFVKIDKTDFNNVLDILDNDVREAFNSNSCNYDGLVYLINGINSGVSLSLTDEQKNAILYLIHKLNEKEEEHNALIDGFKLVKGRYAISDVDELKNKKEKYLKVLDDLDNQKYVSDTSLLLESINFADLSEEKTIDILKYVLEYNANIHNSDATISKEIESEINESHEEFSDQIEIENSQNKEEQEEKYEDAVSFDDIDNNKEYESFHFTPVSEDTEENDYKEFHFNAIPKDDLVNYSYDDANENKENDDIVTITQETNDEVKLENNDTYTPIVDIPSEYSQNDILTFDNNESLTGEKEEVQESEITSSDVVNEENESVDNEPVEYYNDKVSTNDFQMLLEKYNIQVDNTYVNELVTNDIKSYDNILSTLNENGLIDSFKDNHELLIETLLYSDSDIIKNVLRIIKDDLSVDDEDYVITTKIVINTIPSIFIEQGGNYHNFIENIKTFKELDLNLINLFDFSKELFVVNHDRIVENLEIVRKYDLEITYQNAKYLLLLPNIGDRLDYYVESVYEDKVKNEKFDGIEYIEFYPAKLNVVTDETIKRLRYSSENGEKVFGNKPKSLVGEITNLKVNSLDISDDYYDKFFNNNFATLTGDEVREYTKLIHNSTNVGNYDDELEFLDKYRDGIRYVIDNIIVSYNKVVRNYSILRSYGIDCKKALDFAVCYNLVITKDEYDKLKNVLDELGGNK